jgi:Ser/Thr protein kinase RdoA (MazF antagonist)
MEKTKEHLLSILSLFQLGEHAADLEPFGNGHINDTYKVVTEQNEPKYILQRINHYIFKDVDMLQNNIRIVTSHIRKKLEAAGETDIDRKVLTFIPTKSGKYYYYDNENYWRVCRYIEDSVSYDDEINLTLAFETGKSFGRFQSMLADVPDGALGETIPKFHNMEFRLEQLEDAIKANSAGRLDEVQDLLNEIKSRSEKYCIQEELFRKGQLKKRINHCDTKLNNILFDKNGNTLCVIDLDTVMPGYVLSDIGDFIRTACNTGAEDDENLDNIKVNLEIFKAYTRGYMKTAKDFLTPLEIELLPYGGRLLTYMQAVRFLTDYLDGDKYYKIHSPKHNLQRTKAQFKFLQELESHEEEMNAFVKSL